MSSQENTNATQNKPNGYINVSASVKNNFVCCISKNATIQTDVSNRKIHNKGKNEGAHILSRFVRQK